MRYLDCQRADGNCSACSLSNYNRDCHNAPINNLAYYRFVAGLSQSQLADQADISVRVLQNYEQGVRDLSKASAITVLRIAKAIGVTVEDLIDAV